MANPQLENGYVRIANEILEALAKIRIPGEARQVLDFIFRKTYGWGKKEDKISLSQFVSQTGIKKPHILRAIYKLERMNLITKKGNETCNIYSFNKHFHEWQALPKKVIKIFKLSSLKKHCYVCKFTEAIERHHIKPLSMKGLDRVSNIIILCPNCHTLAHKNKYTQKYLLTLKGNAEKVTQKGNQSSNYDEKGLPQKVPTKDTSTKDTSTKEKAKRKMPISQTQFDSFLNDSEFIKEQSQKLSKKFSKNISIQEVKNKIEAIKDGVLSKGYKYYDLPATLRNWFKKDFTDNSRKKPMSSKEKLAEVESMQKGEPNS